MRLSSFWPAELPGLGARRIGAYTPCADCDLRPRKVRGVTIGGQELLPCEPAIGTWVRYGDTPQCFACAQRRSF